MTKKKIGGIKKWLDFIKLLDASEEKDEIDIECTYSKIKLKVISKSKDEFKRKPYS